MVNSFVANSIVPSNSYYDNVYLGEKNFKQYYGPLYPEHLLNKNSRNVEFVDELYFGSFFDKLVEPKLIEWNSIWTEELPSQSSCPNYYLNQNIDYIRYLYRLLTISYAYEAIKDYNILLYRLGMDDSKCSLKWKDNFKACRPKSLEMRKFIKRAKYKYLSHFEEGRFILQTKKQRGKWLSKYRRDYKNYNSLGIAEGRISYWCQNNNENCSQLSMGKIESIIHLSCKRERKLIGNICNEKDELYGLSSVAAATELLKTANTLAVINSGGYGEECLTRFMNLFKRNERKYNDLPNLFKTVKINLKKNNSRYLQGAVFIPGALKEFDDKGLGDFLFAKIAPTPKPRPVPKPVLKPVPRPVPKPVVIEVRPRPTPKPAPRPIVTPKPIKRSQFEIARVERIREKLKIKKVDMELFKSDYVFSEIKLRILEEPLKNYQTRQALKDMKVFDKLGSQKEPVRLTFLKYFIDLNNHQGLYNIQAVLGKSFWVKNDIDNINGSTYIEIKNDKSTNHKWTIFVLKAPK